MSSQEHVSRLLTRWRKAETAAGEAEQRSARHREAFKDELLDLIIADPEGALGSGWVMHWAIQFDWHHSVPAVYESEAYRRAITKPLDEWAAAIK